MVPVLFNKSFTTQGDRDMDRLHLRRWRWVACCLVLLATVSFCRLVDLVWVRRAFLQARGASHSERVVTLPGYRGRLMDCHRQPLAVSLPATTVWFNPSWALAHWRPSDIRSVARTLGWSVLELKRQMVDHRSFRFLKRRVAPSTQQALKRLKLKGLGFQDEYRRYYGLGEAGATLIGRTNVDDQGQEGMELAFDRWLRGYPGKQLITTDRLGQVVATNHVLARPQPGQDLVTSVDRDLQSLAYRALREGIEAAGATSGSVVVLNPQNGEVLAMASYPSYDPHDPNALASGLPRNRAVTDAFEPGSTLKPFTILQAMEQGGITGDTLVNTHGGSLPWVDGYTVRDAHQHASWMRVKRVLQRSSNVGVAVIAQPLSAASRVAWLQTFGFGRRWLRYPGEAHGVLPNPHRISSVGLATLAFGYGLSVTNVQLAHAFAILANGGMDPGVTLIKGHMGQVPHRVVAEPMAKAMVAMLEGVVQRGGTGWRANVRGTQVAGKTGTTHVAKHHAYAAHDYIASFVGMFPASHPSTVISVVINHPRAQRHFGGQVAAPVFADIVRGMLAKQARPPASRSDDGMDLTV